MIFTRLLHNPTTVIGGILVVLFLLTALLAPFLSPHDPTEQNLMENLNKPSSAHILGQDDIGRDVLSRIIYGARISLKVSMVTMIFSLLLGTLLGMLAGFYGKWVDEIIMRITDIMMAFPGILLAIAIMAVLGQSMNNLIFALILVNWKSFARLVRAEFLREKARDYVAAAKISGFSNWRIMFRHILPNAVNPIIVNATLGMASIILAEAGLSFLGLGAPPEVSSWGAMLNDGRGYILQAPHLTLFPGIAIMLAVLGFTLLGDGIRDALDPNFESKEMLRMTKEE
ncbi:MAG: ABC transporter permease [Calditrichia bacterium]|nr:ABC transporter permease [Calditrichia bacterium]